GPSPASAGRVAAVYTPRSPTTGVLYGVVRGHLADFLATVAARTGGDGLPSFVVGGVRKFLRCGVLADGFARCRCGGWALDGAWFLPELWRAAHGRAGSAPGRSCPAARRARATVGALGSPPPALPSRLRSPAVPHGPRGLRASDAERVSPAGPTPGPGRRRD